MEPFSLRLQIFVCIGLFLHRSIAIAFYLLQVRGQLGDLLCPVFRFLRQLANLTLEVLKLSLLLL